MFSVGDALLVGIVLLFGIWALKRIYPDKFASEFWQVVRRQRLKEEAQESAYLVGIMKKAVTVALAEHEQRQAKARDAVVPIKRDDGREPGIVHGPIGLAIDPPYEPNVGRAHVVEDGAFAGGLVKEGK